MQARTLIPHRVNVDSISQEKTSWTSFSIWSPMTRQTLRWVVRRRQRRVFWVSCGTLPAAASAYTMLVASDVTRHTYHLV
jgi:hypothetical protein